MTSISYKDLEPGKIYCSNSYFFLFEENFLENPNMVKFEKVGVTSVPGGYSLNNILHYVSSWSAITNRKVWVILPDEPILFAEKGVQRKEDDMGDGHKVPWKIITGDKMGWIVIDDWIIFTELSPPNVK